MLKLTGKVERAIWLLVYGLFIVLLGIMIVLSVTKPQHNLVPWQMAVGTIVGTCFFVAAFFWWDKLSFQKMKPSFCLFAVLSLVFGVLLYAASCIGRNDLLSLGDYYYIWNAAEEVSNGQALSHAWYFKTYANNIKPMLYLSVIFRGADLFHVEPFYFVLFLSVLEVVASVWATRILVRSSEKVSGNLGIPVLLMFVFTLPIWANVQAFYTDGMGFAVGIVVLAFLKLCFEADSGLKTGAYLLLAGGVLGIGISVKATVLIPAIAGFIIFCFISPSVRWWKIGGLFLICVLTAYVATDLWAQKYEIYNEAKESSMPIVNWIALGMKGDGSYADNMAEYAWHAAELPTKQEKKEYALDYIWQNRSQFWNLSHLVQKLRCNFASGSLGSKDYAYYPLKEHNPIWELFSPWGKYYRRTSQLCFCYLFSIYTCYLCGGVLTFCNLLKKRGIPAIKAVADLALLGDMIFLMLWESNTRQLYNQAPVIILGGVLNILYIVRFFRACPKELQKNYN